MTITNEALKRLYESGLDSSQLATRFGRSQSAITERLRRAGTVMRKRSVRQQRYRCDPDCFVELTPESLYWAGFLFADGYIKRPRGKTPAVAIEVNRKDEAMLIALKAFMAYTGPICHRIKKQKSGYRSRMAVLVVTAQELVRSLSVFGVVPRKSLTAKIPNKILEHPLVEFFFRGLFDGDGCVGVRRRGLNAGQHFATLAGTPAVIRAFQLWCEHRIGIAGNISKRKSTCWVLNFSYKAVPRLGAILYGDVRGQVMARKSKLFTRSTG